MRLTRSDYVDKVFQLCWVCGPLQDAASKQPCTGTFYHIQHRGTAVVYPCHACCTHVCKHCDHVHLKYFRKRTRLAQWLVSKVFFAMNAHKTRVIKSLITCLYRLRLSFVTLPQCWHASGFSWTVSSVFGVISFGSEEKMGKGSSMGSNVSECVLMS